MPDSIDVAVSARRLEAGRKAAATRARMKKAEIAASKARHPSRIPGLRPLDRARGCLLGGAVGDALGGPVEFLATGQIRSKFGPAGVTRFEQEYGLRGSITDDTQMTFFTAEGLIRAIVGGREHGVYAFPRVTHHAYLRWLHTQGADWEEIRKTKEPPDGWLIGEAALHHRRAPGTTCLTALRGPMGEPYKPFNGSKGCGGVMRTAPVGLLPRSYGDPFVTGCEVAAITHGHPSGFLSAGFLAMLVAELFDGSPMEVALDRTEAHLMRWPEYEEVGAAVTEARRAAWSKPPTPENIEHLGEGWVAEEALAIAIFCAVTATDFRSGVLAAVNHGGDSDSTGAITGNILGTLLGVGAIPAEWLQQVEAGEIAETLAGDLLKISGDDGPILDADRIRYPGW